MRLIAPNLIFFPLFFWVVFFFFPKQVFAATTSFRSATTVTTDTLGTFYTNLSNCSLTDGATCDRAMTSGYGNVYFRNFGDFSIPSGSVIKNVLIRLTSKSTYGVYVGVSTGTTFADNCGFPSEQWATYGSTSLTTFNFKTPLTNGSLAICLSLNSLQNNRFVWRVNYASSNMWSANIDNFEIAFDYDPPPNPTATPTPTPTPKTPLILIPGIGGSELKTNEAISWNKPDGHGGTFIHTYPAEERVWVNNIEALFPGEDDYFDILRLKADGQISEANLALTGNILMQEAIDFFTASGYTLNKDFFIFPYDWRKNVASTKSLLDDKIQSIKQQTSSTKVDIVAHSMGGLVARNYISDSTKAQNVRKLFTLGTPHLGSVDSLKTLRYGGCLTDERLKDFPICLGVNSQEAKDVIQNMISAYELTPTQTYFDFYSGEDNDHPYPYKTESGALHYAQIKNLLGSLGHNTALFAPSETLHTLDTNLSNTNGVDVTLIAGSGQPTLGQIIEEKTTSLLGIQQVHKDIRNINGDGTVPLFSASLNDSGKNKSLLGSAKVYYTNQTHGGLVASGSALQLVKNILQDSNQLPSGVSTQAYSLPFITWLLSVHSPVNMHVYDANGNHTGPTTDGFEANIPGSSYDTLGDAKFAYLPENGNYTVKFEATDKGSFDFKIRKLENDTVSEQTLYKDIPLTVVTKAETQFVTSSTQAPIVHLDKDGNGITDVNINPSAKITGNAVFDDIAPQTTAQLSGTLGKNGWYTSDVVVSLAAKDEASGSGVAKIEYSLDNGHTVQPYAEPFTISQEGKTTLKFKSFDNAGNEEYPKELEIKIDKTAPEAKIFVNQDTQDLVIEGIDKNLTTIQRADNSATKKKDDAVYTITDVAGNFLKIDVRERDKDTQDRLRIYAVRYNNNPIITLKNNHFNVLYNGKKSRVNVKEQKFELKGEVKIRIYYDAKKNQSTIRVKEAQGKRVKETKSGLILLQLVTDKGHLKTSY